MTAADAKVARLMREVEALWPLVVRMRMDVHCVKGEYGPARRERPIDRGLLQAHLGGGAPIGQYPMLAGTDTTSAALLDLDDHERPGIECVGWEAMCEAALRLLTVLHALGLRPHVWRSGGGRGIHILLVWDTPQDAHSVRVFLCDALTASGFKEGTGGVVKAQVEVFPKQASVAPGKFGNMFILPGSRRSVPLDMITLAELGREAIETYQWVDSPAVPFVAAPPPRLRVVRNTPAEYGEIAALLDAIPNSGEHELAYEEWRNVIFAVHFETEGSDEGLELAEAFSAKASKHDAAFLEQRVWPYIDSNRSSPVTIGSLRRLAHRYGYQPPPPRPEEFPDIPESEARRRAPGADSVDVAMPSRTRQEGRGAVFEGPAMREGGYEGRAACRARALAWDLPEDFAAVAKPVIRYPANELADGERNPLLDALAQVAGVGNDEAPLYVITAPLGPALMPGRICRKGFMHELLGHFKQDGPIPEDGSEPKSFSLFSLWLKDSQRQIVKGVVIRPASPPRSITGDNNWNAFPGMATRPCRDDVLTEFYLAWVEGFFSERTPDGGRELTEEGGALMRRFLQWQAHLLRYPEERRTTSWTFLAQEEGIGKSLILSVPAHLIGMDRGQGAKILSNEDIESPWTEWIGQCIYAFFDEPSTKSKKIAARLRLLRTAETLDANTKFGAKFSVSNMLTLSFATNSPFAFSISEDARRDWVFSPQWKASEMYCGRTWEDWCTEIGRRLSSKHDPGMREALMHYFLREVDLDGYNPRERAGDSHAKRVAAEASKARDEGNEDEAWKWVEEVVAEHGGLFVRAASIATVLEAAGIDMPVKAFQAMCRTRGAQAGWHVKAEAHRFSDGSGRARCYYVGPRPWSLVGTDKKERMEQALRPGGVDPAEFPAPGR